MDQIAHGEILPSWSGPILYQSHHDSYACLSCNGAALSDGDRTDSSSRVTIDRRVWEPVVMSCLALNDHVVRECWLPVHLPGIGDSRARLPGSRARAKLGYKEKIIRANRWQDPARLQLLRWNEKDRYGSGPHV
jgi:hypothetical protein